MIGYEKHRLFDDNAAHLTPDHWYHKRRHRNRQEQAMKSFVPAPGTLPTLADIANHEFLLIVFEEMKRKGGQAPGLDGLRYDDFSRSEIADVLRNVVQTIRNGTYRPQPYRSVMRPKEDGTFRELRLRNIIDRVIAGAINRALVPYFEPRFLPCSYGFRVSPKTYQTASEEQQAYNTSRLLAELDVIVNEEQRYVLVIDDVRKAFDNVDISIVLAILAKHITETALLKLIEVVLRGDDNSKPIGIDQGSPLSPLILNILLDEIHDQLLHKEKTNPLTFRYADNLTNACKTIEEGNQTLEKIWTLLEKAGLTLKGKKDGHPVVDLREEKAQLLGFTLSVKMGKFHFELGEKAWTKLNKALREAYETSNPGNTARQIMTGWVWANGPALHHQAEADTLERIFQTAAELGFYEDISYEDLKKAWNSARSRWTDIRKVAQQRYEDSISKAALSEDAVIASGSATATPPGTAPHAGGPVSQLPLEGEALSLDSMCFSLPQTPALEGISNANVINCLSSKLLPSRPWAEPMHVQVAVAWCLQPGRTLPWTTAVPASPGSAGPVRPRPIAPRCSALRRYSAQARGRLPPRATSRGPPLVGTSLLHEPRELDDGGVRSVPFVID
jgi:retron-type reverse transcriptase